VCVYGLCSAWAVFAHARVCALAAEYFKYVNRPVRVNYSADNTRIAICQKLKCIRARPRVCVVQALQRTLWNDNRVLVCARVYNITYIYIGPLSIYECVYIILCIIYAHIMYTHTHAHTLAHLISAGGPMQMPRTKAQYI